MIYRFHCRVPGLMLVTVFSLLLLTSCSKENNLGRRGIARQVLTTLAQTDWNGRATGSEGNSAAADYLAQLLSELGYASFDGNGYKISYEQNFVPDAKATTEFYVTYGNGDVDTLTPGVDYSFNLGLPGFDVSGEVGSDIPLYSGQTMQTSIPGSTDVFLISRDSLPFGVNGYKNEIPYPINVSEEIYNKLTKSGVSYARIRHVPYHSPSEADNIVGVLPGMDRTKAFVISAHFDGIPSFGEAALTSAYDNGSGVAALAHASKILSEKYKNTPPEQDVVICFFNGEETDASGSMFFAPKLESHYNATVIINIDCVGGLDAGPLAMATADERSFELSQAMCDSLSEAGILYDDTADYGASDHLSFYKSPVVVLGQRDLFSIAHRSYDMIESVSIEEVEKIGAVVADFVVKHNAAEFLYDNNRQDCSDAMEAAETNMFARTEFERIAPELELAYDEIFVFDFTVVIDGEDCDFTFATSGYRTINTLKEFSDLLPECNLDTILALSPLQGCSFNKFDAHGMHCEEDCFYPYYGQERGIVPRPVVTDILQFAFDNDKNQLVIFYLHSGMPDIDYYDAIPLPDMPGWHTTHHSEVHGIWGLCYIDEANDIYIEVFYSVRLHDGTTASLLETEEVAAYFARELDFEVNALPIYEELFG